jgi:CubicO group peptidase (beta-lactamase class C family)
MRLGKICLIVATLMIIGGGYFYPKMIALKSVAQLFDSRYIVENFSSAKTLWPSTGLTASPTPRPYPERLSNALPEDFNHAGKTYRTGQFLDDSWTTGLLVIQDDALIFENYYLGNSVSTQHISWSVAKSFISALIGIAVDEGQITSIEEPVDLYAPELIGSGYQSVRIKDVLQMSSGIGFDEDYADFNSDINRWGRDFALGNSQDAFAASLSRSVTPGTLNHYVSIDTHVLGMVLARATGRTITDYMQTKLYQPMGMEQDGYWIIDGHDVEMALGGLNLTLRDFAKLGSLYLNNGRSGGRQIVPTAWVDASLTPDAPHLMPGDNFGYGYQWWIPAGQQGEFMAQGVYNQYIYVNRATRTVIVKFSANPRYNDPDHAPASDRAHLALFRAIAANNNPTFKPVDR